MFMFHQLNRKTYSKTCMPDRLLLLLLLLRLVHLYGLEHKLVWRQAGVGEPAGHQLPQHDREAVHVCLLVVPLRHGTAGHRTAHNITWQHAPQSRTYDGTAQATRRLQRRQRDRQAGRQAGRETELQ